MQTGIELIAAERKRQQTEENWSPGHDDEHEYGELRDAAEAYLWELRARPLRGKVHTTPPPAWRWDIKWWKPTDDPIRQLVKAGALAQVWTLAPHLLPQAHDLPQLQSPKPHRSRIKKHPQRHWDPKTKKM